MYTGIDLGVELLVFAFTILALRYIFPEFNAFRILSGLLKMHSISMFVLMFTVWFGNLFYQCTYSGMDPLFKFQWLNCNGNENSTWIGGYKWEC